jgi:hypothetical protein
LAQTERALDLIRERPFVATDSKHRKNRQAINMEARLTARLQ